MGRGNENIYNEAEWSGFIGPPDIYIVSKNSYIKFRSNV